MLLWFKKFRKCGIRCFFLELYEAQVKIYLHVRHNTFLRLSHCLLRMHAYSWYYCSHVCALWPRQLVSAQLVHQEAKQAEIYHRLQHPPFCFDLATFSITYWVWRGSFAMLSIFLRCRDEGSRAKVVSQPTFYLAGISCGPLDQMHWRGRRLCGKIVCMSKRNFL